MKYNLSQYDTVIVLNGGADETGELYQDTKARVEKGILAAIEYRISDVVMVGHESHQMREFALDHFPAAKSLNILVEDRSHSTPENAHYVKKTFLEPNNWRSIVLVTEKFHSSRARYTFERILGDGYKITSVDSVVGYTPQQRQELAEHERHCQKTFDDAFIYIRPEDDVAREEWFARIHKVPSYHSVTRI